MHKKKAKVDIEDLFGDEAAASGHDLFAEPTVDKTPTPVVQTEATAKAEGTSTAPTTRSSTTRGRVSAASDPFKRSALLDKHLTFMQPRLGSSPSKTQPKIRSRTWLSMIQLAKDGEDMRKVVDLIPKLHEGGGALPSRFAEEFVREWSPLLSFYPLKSPQNPLISRSLRATTLPTSCLRGIRQLCKIQHRPNSEHRTLANSFHPRPLPAQRSSRCSLTLLCIQHLPC